jgi:soluble lytic murein transglycosylase-like protein
MTQPTTPASIPLRNAGSSTTPASRPGQRPPGTTAARPNQNAFAQALARAQSTNSAMRGATMTPGLGATPGMPFGEQTGLPTDIQSLMQQGGLPPSFQAMMQQSTPLAVTSQAIGAQAAGAQGAGPQPAAKPSTVQVPGGFGPIIQEAAQKYGVDPALIAAVMETESKFNPDAVSQAGARGLMQLMPATARGLGVTDAKDPRQAILGGAKLLGILSDKYKGDIKLTLAAYNAGSGAVDKHGGIPPYGETQKYVPLVMSAYERFKAQFGTQATPVSGPGTGR